jgi:tight adherence protein C
MLMILFFMLAFLLLATIIYTGFQLMQPQEDPLTDRLSEIQTSTGTTKRRTGTKRYFGGGFLNSFVYVVSRAGGEGWIRDTDRELAQAGIRNQNATAFYLLGSVIFAVVLVGGMIYFQVGNDVTQQFGGIVSVLLLAYVIPPQVLHRLVKRYRAKLQDALPDTVDLLGIVLGTGLALDQAMLRVSDEMQFIYPDLANEFATVVMQVKAGQERSVAFTQLIRRTGIEDIKSLAAMIVQSERFGTSLSQALNVYAQALRQKRRLRAEAAVGKAGIKMLLPIIIFILPVLFIVTLVPGLAIALAGLRGGVGAGH